jgi:hypothetical protein
MNPTRLTMNQAVLDAYSFFSPFALTLLTLDLIHDLSGNYHSPSSSCICQTTTGQLFCLHDEVTPLTQ